MGEPRRFVLRRTEDETGVSGTGDVAWGVLFPDGKVVTRWCVTDIRQTCCWDSMADAEAIHGHNGKTQIIWLDHPEDPDDETSGLSALATAVRRSRGGPPTPMPGGFA